MQVSKNMKIQVLVLRSGVWVKSGKKKGFNSPVQAAKFAAEKSKFGPVKLKRLD
jgi:hypothetical protein